MNEVANKKYTISGHEIQIKRDLTVRKEWYYCVLGVSKRKVIYGGSIDIVYRKCLKSYEKKEVSFDPILATTREVERVSNRLDKDI